MDRSKLKKIFGCIAIVAIIIGMAYMGIQSYMSSKISKEIPIAKQEFERDMISKYEDKLRRVTKLDDLTLVFNYNDYLDDIVKKNGSPWINAGVNFISEKAKKYLTEESRATNGKELVSILKQIAKEFSKHDDYKYVLSNGNILSFHIYGCERFLIWLDNEENEYINCTSYLDDGFTCAEYNDDYIAFDTGYTRSDSYSSSGSSSKNNSSYSGAYDATLKYSGTSGVLICATEDAMERFMTAVNNGNEGTLEELFLNGQCAYTEQGTKCNIVDKKFTKCKVKLLDGSYAGNTVWVVIEALQEK